MSFLVRILFKHGLQLCDLLCKHIYHTIFIHHVLYFYYDVPFGLVVESVILNFSRQFYD